MPALSTVALASPARIAAQLQRGGNEARAVQVAPSKVQLPPCGISLKHGPASSRVPRDDETSQPAPMLSRRSLVGGVALSAVLLLPPTPAPARASLGTFCEDFRVGSDGMFFCDKKVGEGKVVVPGDTISCHYTSRLAQNGFKFDSSYDYMGGETPFVFQVGNGEVIRGWDLGILGAGDMPAMRVGGKRTLVIPSELGYGRWGAGDQVPPDSILVYDIEVIG